MDPREFATDEDIFAELIAYNKKFGESCLDLTGPLAGFMDSISTAKDLELLRQALGGNLLNYLGLSYGTVLGQNYAELYPENVGRMVLMQFFSWCNETTECTLSGKDLPTIFLNLTSTTSLPTTSLPTTQCHDAINQTLNGDASAFSRMLALNNTDTSPESDFAANALFCQDFGSSLTSSTDLKSLVEVASTLLQLARGAGQAFSPEVYCANWPARVLDPPRPLNAEQVAKLPTIMMLLLYGDTSKAMDEFLINGMLPSQGIALDS
ncbi:hypothetical protein B7494_g4689 [Chlorociboria aeruginascens]|nr:hypothetical protein B7494_g4689 [Chlorociboria aeruginascens]